jgi:hypothetical protein
LFTAPTTSAPTASAGTTHNGSLSGGAIAGIAIGAVVGAGAIIAGLWLLLGSRRTKADKGIPAEPNSLPKDDIGLSSPISPSGPIERKHTKEAEFNPYPGADDSQA